MNMITIALLVLLCGASAKDERQLQIPHIEVVTTSQTPGQLGLCAGDCDNDGHCIAGLVCFQRKHNQSVPGCDGGETDPSLTDYCIEDIRHIKVVTTSQTPGQLGLCAGDCDNDGHCNTGLVCFQRKQNQSVPGCDGGETDPSLTDYCIEDNQSTPIESPASSPTVQPVTHGTSGSNDVKVAHLVSFGGSPTSKSPLGICEGDCDNDNQCDGNLICFQRHRNFPVPGCTGTDASETDFCIDPRALGQPPTGENSITPITSPTDTPVSTPADDPVLRQTLPPVTVLVGRLESFGGSPPVGKLPLGVCQGDCDNDNHCDGDLVCFQRTANQPVPGCTGSDRSETDFCVDPNALGTLPTPDDETDSPVGSPTVNSLSPAAIETEPARIGVLKSFGGSPPADKFPLDLCEGDCDDDTHCKGNLVCFQRTVGQPVPGCMGIDASETDFCVDPNTMDVDLDIPLAGPIDYIPGHLTVRKVGLLLSQGLDARLIATTGQLVTYADGAQSSIPFHGRPDAGATFAGEGDGFVYVSNSEMRTNGDGGVGAIRFDAQGNILNYDMVLTGTTMNCGGGRTPWNTWVTCEEKNDRSGKAYQVDPFGNRSAQQTTIGSEGGRWESFAFDDRDRQEPRFFMTEDHPRGALSRFTPSDPNWNEPWRMLHDHGTKDYLKLHSNGNFEWIANRIEAMENARVQYQDSEGIDVRGSELLFVSKSLRMLYTLDLDNMLWTKASTVSGLFDGQPDQLQRLLDSGRDLLYFTEEGGRDAGVHARDEMARFYTVLESPVYPGETTGLAMSPRGKFMIVAYQDVGRLFLIWRRDGKAFGAEHVDIKFHDSTSNRLF